MPGSPAAELGVPGSPRTQAEREAQWAPYVQRMQQRSELKQAKAHERPPAAARLARFLPRKLRDKLAKAGGGSGGGGGVADGGPAGVAGGRYARAPAAAPSDPDKRE